MRKSQAPRHTCLTRCLVLFTAIVRGFSWRYIRPGPAANSLSHLSLYCFPGMWIGRVFDCQGLQSGDIPPIVRRRQNKTPCNCCRRVWEHYSWLAPDCHDDRWEERWCRQRASTPATSPLPLDDSPKWIKSISWLGYSSAMPSKDNLRQAASS